MFEVCGVDLGVDTVSGKRENFASVAHDVGVAERGALGDEPLAPRVAHGEEAD